MIKTHTLRPKNTLGLSDLKEPGRITWDSFKIQTPIPVLNLLNQNLWGWDLGYAIPRLPL